MSRIQFDDGGTDNVDNEQKSGSMRDMFMKKRLSIASQRLDRGEKGYLDDIEQCCRKYDIDNDGQFSIDEVVKIVEDLEDQRHKKHVVKRKLWGTIGLAFVLLLCVFGLMMSTVILSRKVNVDESTDALVSDKTGHILITGSRSAKVVVEMDEIGGTNRALDEESRVLTGVSQGKISKTEFVNAYATFDGNPSVPLQVTVKDNTGNDIGTYTLEDGNRHDYELPDESRRYVGLKDTTSNDENPIFHRFECPKRSGPAAKCNMYIDQAPLPIVGGLTNDSAVVGFSIEYTGDVKVQYSTVASMFGASFSEVVSVTDTTDYTGSVKLTGLAAGGPYYYRIVIDNWVAPPGSCPQKFRTLPNDNSQVFFSVFADSANANLDRSAAAYQSAKGSIDDADHYFSMQIGDFDHDDPPLNDFDEMLEALRRKHRNLRDPAKIQGVRFFCDVLAERPMVHVWDDHDYCGNDADGTCEHKNAALQAYKEYYPGYDLPSSNNGIWHSFTAGAAEIFMLDTRYQRTPDNATDDANKSVLGSEQKQWLKDGLSSSSATWKIIVSTITSNYFARPGNIDHWGSFTFEANEMKNFIKNNGLEDSTIMISGDLHTGGAVDDGCANRWGIPELGVPHTNLGNGNADSLGEWSEGQTSGQDSAFGGGASGGYGLVKVKESELTISAMDTEGNQRHTISLPLSRGDCDTFAPTATPAPTKQGFIECSSTIKKFVAPPTVGECANANKTDEFFHPYPKLGGGTLTNDIRVYECSALGKRIIRSNAIPDTYVHFGNRHEMCERFFHVEMPLVPVVATQKRETNFLQGIAFNGVPLFNALEAGSTNAAEPSGKIQDADEWWGHPNAGDIWHYHSPYIGHDNATDMPGPETFLGWALDGFKIYGPVADADLGELDDCNFNGTVYHVRTLDQVNQSLPFCKDDTADPSVNWNYILGCYAGETGNTEIKDGSMETVPDGCVEV